MGLIHDDAVEGIHQRRLVGLEDAAHHGLHRRHLDAGFRLGGHVTQFGDVVDF